MLAIRLFDRLKILVFLIFNFAEKVIFFGKIKYYLLAVYEKNKKSKANEKLAYFKSNLRNILIKTFIYQQMRINKKVD